VFQSSNSNRLKYFQSSALLCVAIAATCPLISKAQTAEKTSVSATNFFRADFVSARTFFIPVIPEAQLLTPAFRAGSHAFSSFRTGPRLTSSFLRPAGAPPPGAVNTTWTGGAGNFSNAAMWTAGVPNGNFNAFIDGGNTVASAVTLDINASLNNLTISSGDSLGISNDLGLTVNGTSISNKGQLLLNSVANNTALIVGGSSLTLSGTGVLTMSNNSQNMIYGTVGTNTLINQSTIQGAGSIGSNQLTLSNSGTIDANDPTQLIINPSGGTTNTGTLEATAAGTLSLQNAITNTNGTIQANGAGSTVNLNGAAITGGTLETSSGGVIQSFGGTLSGLTNTGTLQVPNNNALTILGTITNTGSIQLNSVANVTELLVGAPSVTLTGAGTVTLSNNSQNYIFGASASDTLINQTTIQGAGTIGNNQLVLTNSGTIDANDPTQLIINPSGGTTNTGTLEATAGGTLNLQDAVTNSGATIQANGAGSVVALFGASITGGTLNTSNGGAFQSFGATLSGLTNAGTLQILNNNAVTLVGNISNTGSIQALSNANVTEILASGTVTLSGGGTVVLSDNNQNYIFGAAGSQLINQNNTISGSGNIGNNTLAFTNHGTADAMSANGNQLLIQTGTAGTTNTGTLEASSGGTLQIQNTVTNAGGVIQALAGTGTSAGGTVTLNGASVTGGTVQSLGTGVNSGAVVSTGATLTNLTTAGLVETPNNNTLTVAGTINNTGAIQLNSNANATELVASGTVNLTGGGTVALSNNSQNYILGAAGSKLVNTNNTITGAGNIGDGTMAFTNEGTVDAIYSNHLVINTGKSAVTNNTGLMEASKGGVLEIDSAVNNETSTTSGTIEALNGGTVSLRGATINGGNLMSTGTGVIGAAGSTLNGSTYAVNFSGALQTSNNQSMTLAGTINDNGTISIDSTANNTILKIYGSNVTLQGTGKVVLSNNTQNFIEGASTGTEKLTNMVTIEGAGNIGNALLTLDNLATIEATSTTGNHLIIDPGTGGGINKGTMEAVNGATLELENSINNTGGTISATSGSTVQMDGNLALTGGTLSGAGVFTSFGASLSNLTNNSTIAVPNNSSLTLGGTITNTGSIQVNSDANYTYLNTNGTTTLTGGGTVVLSDNPQNMLSGSSGGSFINQNNTISGSGNIGSNTIAFTNQGTVDATSANGNHLIIQAGGAGATNTALMEASSGGTLELQNMVNNTGGNITALAGTGTAAGGTVYINGATVTGGTLNSLGTGVNAGAIISNGGTLVSLTNAGTIQISNNNETFLQGTITNNGTIALNSDANNTYLLLNGNVTLNGTGSVTLSNNTQNFIQGASTGQEVLTNNITIEGSGNIGDGSMGLVNNGVISANQSTPLIIDASSAGFSNTGTLETSAGSTLNITGPFSNFSGTTLTGGKYLESGTLEFTGADIVTNAASITLTGASSAIVDQNGNNALAGFTTNASAGKFTLAGSQTLTTSAGSFTNAGAMLINTGSTFTVGNNGNTSLATNYTQTAGSTTVNGVLASSASSAGTPTVSVQGGALVGDGTVADPLASSGVVEPGDSSTTTGKLDVTGTYAQSSHGSFDVSIGGNAVGTKYDQLDVSGATTLNGTLNIKSINSFVPAVGAKFVILDAGSLTGTFSTITGTSINSSEHYVVSYTGTEVILTVVSGAGVVPASSPALISATRSSDPLHLGVVAQNHSIGLDGASSHVTFSANKGFVPQFNSAALRLGQSSANTGFMASLANVTAPRFTSAGAFGGSTLHTALSPVGQNPARKLLNYHLDLGTMLSVGRSRGFAAAVKELTTHYSNLGYLEYR
jgi:hypothetical protein